MPGAQEESEVPKVPEKLESLETQGKPNKEVNKDKERLPKTGGRNAIGVLAIGSAIIALGGLLVYRRKKK